MQRQHILIVEDDAIIAARLHDILLLLGYDVSEPVSSGEDAIASSVSVRPNLILMDINLYGPMNGIKAAEAIRAMMDVPIVYLTAYSDDDLLQQAKVTNPYGYLVKPVQERELQATIEMALHNHAMAKAVRESEERYRAVIVNAMDAVFLFDAQTLRLVETNQAFRRLLGYADDNCAALSLSDFMRLPETRIREIVEQALRLGSIEPGERRYKAKDGRSVDVIASASVISCSGRATICVVAHDISQRKRAEEQLQESESRLKIILKSIRAGVLIVDAETHRIEDVNDEAARILGRSNDELIGLKCNDIVCPARAGACPITGEGLMMDVADHTAIRPNGESVPIIKMVKMISIDGRRHLLETFIDVSDRKRAEEALTEERNLLQTVVNSLPHQIYAKDVRKRFILSNTCNTASLGFSCDTSLLGKTDKELFAHDVSERFNTEEDLILKGETPLIDSVHEVHDPSTGRLLRSLQIAKHPLRNAEGVITGVVGINIDRTKETLAEFELRESEERFRSIIENIGEGLLIFDMEGAIEYVNRAASEFYQCPKEEMIGSSIAAFMPGELSTELLERRLQTLKNGKALVYEIDITPRSSTERRSLLAAIVARRTSDGRLTGAYETITDITERKSAETAIAERNRQLMISNMRAEDQARLLKQQTRELEKARHQAVEASRMKSEFVANMSHEIRTPLNGIIGMASLLVKTDLTQQQSRFLSVINSSSNSLLAIINEILDFSKIEAGKMELKEDDFSLRSELEYATETFWYKAREKGVELTCIVDIAVPDELYGDALRLRQVLTNLLGNAVKFTQKGMIALHVRFVEENAFGLVLNFTISDTGIGIAPEAMKKLFRPFSQVNGTTTREHGGTGLGLTISKRLIELLGGSISVVSRVDRGTIFRFTITFTHAHAPQSVAAVTAAVQGPRAPYTAIAGKKILLAHTDPTARKILQMMANAFHLPFAVARSGASAEYMLAAAAADNVPYDVLFVGEQFDDKTSSDLLKGIEAHPLLSKIKTVLVGPFTAGVTDAVTRNAHASGVLNRFSKQSEFYDVLCSASGYEAAPADAADETNGAKTDQSPTVIDTEVRILVVDDNQINQQVASDLLEAMGYHPQLVINGERAVAAVMEEEFDIIFMDCQMPVMDGYEATRTIRRNLHTPEHPVIIAMTAHAIGGDKEACLESGMNDYIAKPIRFEELRIIIEKWKRKLFHVQERAL
ncbi:MAG TPA: PAS domain S-box protein [Bacteroidota bacterium]|nr:PAS domain S-box protein [Bacteroidota bacterium]